METISIFKDFVEAYKIAKVARMIDRQEKSMTRAELLPNYKIGRPQIPIFNTQRAIKRSYQGSSYVYACISLIAKTSASIPWRAVKLNRESGIWEDLQDHPLTEILRKPNPWQDGTALMNKMVTFLYIGGNGFISKVRDNTDTIGELYILPPDAMMPVPNRQEFITEYEYRWEGRLERLPAQDIIQIMFPNPENPFFGMSPLQPLSRTIDTELSALEWQRTSFQNRAVADGIFSFEHDITPNQFERARQFIREQRNTREPWVLGQGAKWQQMALTAIEMDFINTRKYTREEICAVLGVPPVMIGILDNATLANIEVARKIFWLDTIIPLLETVQSAYNLFLAPEFGNDDIRVEYDITGVEALQENFGEKVQTAQRLWNMGVPFNEINKQLELGFDEIEGGDIPHIGGGNEEAPEPELELNHDRVTGLDQHRKKKRLSHHE